MYFTISELPQISSIDTTREYKITYLELPSRELCLHYRAGWRLNIQSSKWHSSVILDCTQLSQVGCHTENMVFELRPIIEIPHSRYYHWSYLIRFQFQKSTHETNVLHAVNPIESARIHSQMLNGDKHEFAFTINRWFLVRVMWT